MKTLIKLYIQSKELAWSPNTLRSEAYRLHALQGVLDDNPPIVWDFLSPRKPYTKVTTWTRIVDFWDWLIEEKHRHGRNEFRRFRKTNARLFKHTYTRNGARIRYQDAYSKIQCLRSCISKDKANKLLRSGLRYSELDAIKDGIVIGKGGRVRKVYASDTPSGGSTQSYSAFRRDLAEIGLKPHDLRKIFLTEAVRQGADIFELCELAGWSDIKTASSYIKADDKKIKSLVGRIHAGE